MGIINSKPSLYSIASTASFTNGKHSKPENISDSVFLEVLSIKNCNFFIVGVGKLII
jgi:hypothetical protein